MKDLVEMDKPGQLALFQSLLMDLTLEFHKRKIPIAGDAKGDRSNLRASVLHAGIVELMPGFRAVELHFNSITVTLADGEPFTVIVPDDLRRQFMWLVD